VKGSGTPQLVLEGHMHAINSVALSADAKRAVSGSGDEELLVWNLDKRAETPEFVLKWPMYNITAVAISADGQRVISGSWDETLMVWNLDKEHIKPEFILKGDRGGIIKIILCNAGKRVISESDTKKLLVWDLEKGSGTPRRIPKDNKVDDKDKVKRKVKKIDEVTSLAVSDNCKYAISGIADNTIKGWDLESESEVPKFILKGHTGKINLLAINADGKRAISGSKDNKLIVWDLEQGTVITRFYSDEPIRTCILSPDNQFILAVGVSGQLFILKIEGLNSLV
jgi:WD40 repeat protein